MVLNPCSPGRYYTSVERGDVLLTSSPYGQRAVVDGRVFTERAPPMRAGRVVRYSLIELWCSLVAVGVVVTRRWLAGKPLPGVPAVR